MILSWCGEKPMTGVLLLRVLFDLCPVLARGVSSTEFDYLEALCKSVVKEKQPFERLEVSRETLLKMFKVRGEDLSTLW